MRYVPHLITLFLIFVAPVWDYFEAKRLKSSLDSRKRVRWYIKLIVASWLFAFAAGTAAGWGNVLTIAARASWSPSREGIRDFVVGLITALFLVQLVVLWKARSNEKVREKIAAALRSLYFILPVTREERWWFFLVSLTAGICEEILYRGFLMNYLMGAPLHAGITLAMLLSSVIFGVGHIYQGVRGAIGSAILGAVFAALFVLTGNLLLPMALHAMIDARILLMIREGEDLAPATET
jgi:uncharacterized protein